MYLYIFLLICLIQILYFPLNIFGLENNINNNNNNKNSKLFSEKQFITENSPCIITSSNGNTIEGVYDSEFQTCSFKSLNFGQDTSQSNRWKSPKPSQDFDLKSKLQNSNEFHLNAKEFGNSCPQQCVLPDGFCPEKSSPLSEDCLNLNIYTPSSSSSFISQTQGKNLPVLFYIPGGHFDQGTANCNGYDGRRFVAQSHSVILVVVNYRLGAFGFLADSTRNITGNYGIQDQRLALEYIRKNIELFGGDPNQITVVGQSAGACSIAAHMTSPLSKGLFQRAIMHSNPVTLPFPSMETNTKLAHHFATASQCDFDPTDSCIRKLSFEDVVKYQHEADSHIKLKKPLGMFLPWAPTISKEIPLHPIEAFNQGAFEKIPTMIGTVSEEALMFVFLADSSKMNRFEYEAALLTFFPEIFKTVNTMYPATHDDKRYDLSNLGTDYIFFAPSRNISFSIGGTGTPIYNYQFNHTFSFDGWGEEYSFCNGHVCHGGDLPFLFDSVWVRPEIHFTPQEERLSQLLIHYWTNFVATGNPNEGPSGDIPPNVPEWKQFHQSTQYSMQFNTDSQFNIQFLKAKHSDQWDKLGYHYGR